MAQSGTIQLSRMANHGFHSTSHENNSNFITFAHYELIVGSFLLLRKPIFRFFSVGRTHKDGKWGIFKMNRVCR